MWVLGGQHHEGSEVLAIHTEFNPDGAAIDFKKWLGVNVKRRVTNTLRIRRDLGVCYLVNRGQYGGTPIEDLPKAESVLDEIREILNELDRQDDIFALEIGTVPNSDGDYKVLLGGSSNVNEGFDVIYYREFGGMVRC